MQRDSSSPAVYVRDVEGVQRELLDKIRGLILEVSPEVGETIRHGMLDYPGLANLAAQKNYVALYVAPDVLAKRRGDFAHISCGKSCLRFRRIDQVAPGAVRRLLREVIAYRQEDADGGGGGGGE